MLSGLLGLRVCPDDLGDVAGDALDPGAAVEGRVDASNSCGRMFNAVFVGDERLSMLVPEVGEDGGGL